MAFTTDPVALAMRELAYQWEIMNLLKLAETQQGADRDAVLETVKIKLKC